MSNPSGRCIFSLEIPPSDRGVTTNQDLAKENYTWKCHRRVRPGDSYCIFHAHKSHKDTSVSHCCPVGEVFIDILTGNTDDRPWNRNEPDDLWQVPQSETDQKSDHLRRNLQFIGSSLEEISVESRQLDSGHSYPIDLRYSEIESIDIRDTHFNHSLYLTGSTQQSSSGQWSFIRSSFTGNVNICQTTIKTNLIFAGCTIGGCIDLTGTVVEQTTDFRGISIDGTLNFTECRLANQLQLWDGEIGGDLIVAKSTLSRGTSFFETEIRGNVIIHKTNTGSIGAAAAQIGGKFELTETEIAGRMDGDGLQTNECLIFQSEVDRDISFQNANISESLEFDSTVREDVSLQSLNTGEGIVISGEIGGDLCANKLELDGALNASSLHVDGKIDVSESNITNAAIFDTVEIELLDLTRSKISGQVRMGGSVIDSITAVAMESSSKLIIRHSDIYGDVCLNRIDLKALIIEDSNIKNKLVAKEANITNNIEINDAQSEGPVVFTDTTVDGHINISKTIFGASFQSEGIESEHGITVKSSEINENLSLANIDCEFVYITDLTLGDDFNIASANLNKLEIETTSIAGSVLVHKATIGTCRIGQVTTIAGRLSFDGGQFTTLHLKCILTHPIIDVISLSRIEFEEAFFNVSSIAIALHDGTKSESEAYQQAKAEGTLPPNSTRLVYDLEGATLGAMSVENGEIANLVKLRLPHASFDKFSFSTCRRLLRDGDWALHNLPPGGENAVAIVSQSSVTQKLSNSSKHLSGDECVFDVTRHLTLELTRIAAGATFEHSLSIFSSEPPPQTEKELGNFLRSHAEYSDDPDFVQSYLTQPEIEMGGVVTEFVDLYNDTQQVGAVLDPKPETDSRKFVTAIVAALDRFLPNRRDLERSVAESLIRHNKELTTPQEWVKTYRRAAKAADNAGDEESAQRFEDWHQSFKK